jgi:hypothetical protein
MDLPPTGGRRDEARAGRLELSDEGPVGHVAWTADLDADRHGVAAREQCPQGVLEVAQEARTAHDEQDAQVAPARKVAPR